MQITYAGERLTLIDTAGIRRRGRVEQGIEQYSVLRSMRCHLPGRRGPACRFDAQEGVTAQDTHVAGYVLERKKSVVVLINKWDAIEKDNYTMAEYTATAPRTARFFERCSGALHQRQDPPAGPQSAAGRPAGRSAAAIGFRPGGQPGAG
jgi:GTP-binding protein